MRIAHLSVIAVILSIFFVQITYAQDFLDFDTKLLGWDFVTRVLSTVTGMPTSFFDSLPNFLFHFLIPFLMIWFICLGFMRQIRIFTRAPNWIDWFISFSMAALTVYPTGLFLKFVTFIAAFSGAVATLCYFGMFFLGVVLYTFRWGSINVGVTNQMRDLNRDEKMIRAQITHLRQQYAGFTDPTSAAARGILTKIAQLEQKLQGIQIKRKNLLEV